MQTQPWDPTPHAFKGHGDQCTGCGQLAHHRTHDQLPSSSVAKRQAADHHTLSNPEKLGALGSCDPLRPHVDGNQLAALVAASLKTRHRIAITEQPDSPEHWRVECACGHRGEWRLAAGHGITQVLKDGTTHIEGDT